MENPKSETRNPKEIPSPKSETMQGRKANCIFSAFGLWSFIRISGFGFRVLQVAICLAVILTATLPANAAPTQEDVFKSISSNVDDKAREDKPKVTNHQGKLLRELMKSAGLKRSQIRQLKALSADLAAKNQPVQNLATLLLCPSLIKKARDRDARR